MKWRIFLAGLGLLGFTFLAAINASSQRLPWVAISFLCFLGIYIFDSYSQINKNASNTFMFIIIYGLLLKSILEIDADHFWRDCAGVVFLIALSFEQNADPWVGRGGFKSSIGPSVLFFVFVLASGIPILDARESLTCSLLALILLCFLEIFYILREGSQNHAGSFMSAMRLAASGIICLYFSSTFLPGIAVSSPFIYMQVGLPLLGLFVALFSATFEEVRKRYILFCGGWSLFIFWAAVSGEPYKVYAAIGATVAGSWAVMMTNRTSPFPAEGREVFLRLSAWGIPGSLLFSFIVLTILPSQAPFTQIGSVVWLLGFFIYWARLSRIKWEQPAQQIAPPWTWRNSLALAVTIAGGGLLAGIRVFPSVLNYLLGLAQ